MADVTLDTLTTGAALTVFEMQNFRGYIVPEFKYWEEQTPPKKMAALTLLERGNSITFRRPICTGI